MPSIGIIGLGRVGCTLAFALARAGLPLTALASRDQEKARRLVKTLGRSGATEPAAVAAADILHYADLVFLATPDDAIATTCAALPWGYAQCAVHLSGAQTLEVLASASRRGAAVASFHPLNSFPASDPGSLAELELRAEALKGSYIGLSCPDAGGAAILEEIAASIGAGHFYLGEDQRVLYHAAAVMASNFVTTLLSASAELWRQLGIDEDMALRYTAPLLFTTCHNILTLGPLAALTGPLARGDLGTVQKHLGALDALLDNSRTATLYRALAKATLPLALAKGTIDRGCADELLTLLQTEELPCVK
ncbi:MAG: hypothetical protein DDT35_01025 [Firmicutes bacterium]|nr:hypothetical protein [Bacillota bacterium]